MILLFSLLIIFLLNTGIYIEILFVNNKDNLNY